MIDQSGWRLQSIEVLPNRAVKVTMTTESGRHEQFTTRDFGVGRRRAKCAALARFVAKSWGLEVRRTFRHLLALPQEFRGPIVITDLVPERPVLSVVSL